MFRHRAALNPLVRSGRSNNLARARTANSSARAAPLRQQRHISTDDYPVFPSFKPIQTPMLPEGTFDGKTVFITGGGTGLGEGMATTVSKLGGRVFITSRKNDVLKETSDRINEAVGREAVSYAAADVRSTDEIVAALDAMSEWSGASAPDVVVNNAAGNFVAPTERLSANAFRTVVDIVLNGSANVTLEAGKRMIKRGEGGVFLTVSTTYAQTGSGFVQPSAAAKSGLEAMTKGLAAEWGTKYGIRLNCIAPGPIYTPGAFKRLDPTGAMQKLMIKHNPSRRIGTVEEFANLATFLMSNYGSWMNGEVVRFDGGEVCLSSGEMNHFMSKTDAEWDEMERIIRDVNKKGSK